MCPNRTSLTWYIIRGQLGEAERLLPGHGCDVLQALAAMADMGMIVGAVSALAIGWIMFDLIKRLRRRLEGSHAN